jgi:hypothetical protein
MARKVKPGSERFRDERRTARTPRMHGRTWHDHDEPREIRPNPEELAELDALPEAESSGEREGMRKGHVARKTKGKTRRPSATTRARHQPGASRK